MCLGSCCCTCEGLQYPPLRYCGDCASPHVLYITVDIGPLPFAQTKLHPNKTSKTSKSIKLVVATNEDRVDKAITSQCQTPINNMLMVVGERNHIIHTIAGWCRVG